MKINKEILRGYDIRGLVNIDLNPKIVEFFGRAYGTYMINNGATRVVVGYDSRQSSREYSQAFITGVVSTGLKVIDIGMILVGTLYWAQYHFNTKAAAMITASHNPKEFNGLKLANNFSEAMIEDELGELTQLVENENFFIASQPGDIIQTKIMDEYYADILERVKINKKFKVVVDAGNATAGAIVPELLKRAGCEVVTSNCKINPDFPLGPADPTEIAMAKRLAKKVLDTKADIGFSYDTDGDRIGVVDARGTIVWNDVLVALFAIDVLNKHPHAKIMFNTLCSKVVSDTIVQYGGEPFMWRTGHGFLKKKNQEIGAPFIGELSGHFFFSADFYNHDDGCYATLRLLSYLARSGQNLHEAINKLPKYISSPEIKIYCADDKKRGLINKISPLLKRDHPLAKIIDDERAGDGIRLETDTSMFVIRYSQNGPYITVKFEAKTEKEYNKLKKYLNKLLHQFPEVNWDNEIKVNIESLN